MSTTPTKNSISQFKDKMTYLGLLKSFEFIGDRIAIINNASIAVDDTIRRVNNMFVLCFCTSGSFTLSLNLVDIECVPGSLTISEPGAFLKVPRAEEGSQAWVVLISRQVIEDVIVKVGSMLDLYFYIKRYHQVLLSPKQQERLFRYSELIKDKFDQENDSFKMEITRSLMIALFYEVCGFFNSSLIEGHEERTRSQMIVERFFADLSANFRHQRAVSFYAAKQALSAKYFSTQCKEETGLSAAQWIDKWVIAEAQLLLDTTDMTIQQVSASLNFSDQAFFGKYFKRLTGYSPKEYRHRNKKL